MRAPVLVVRPNKNRAYFNPSSHQEPRTPFLSDRMTDVALQTPSSSPPPPPNNAKDNEGAKPAAFVQKLYTMINSCDKNVATWTKEGNMFVIKQPKDFSDTVIPKYFIHNKFSSFARQLNFYGFRKVPTKPIRNQDYDASTADHVIFHHPLFRKDREDLLADIKRHSTQPKMPLSASMVPKKSAPVQASASVSSEEDTLMSCGHNGTTMTPEEEEEVERLKMRVKGLKKDLKAMEHDFALKVDKLNRDYLYEVKSMLEMLPPGLMQIKTIFERASPLENTINGHLPKKRQMKEFMKTPGTMSSQSRIVSSDLSADSGLPLGHVAATGAYGTARVVGI